MEGGGGARAADPDAGGELGGGGGVVRGLGALTSPIFGQNRSKTVFLA